jgi:hypothetical protein
VVVAGALADGVGSRIAIPAAAGSWSIAFAIEHHQEIPVSVGSDLLQAHIETLVADHARWQTLIADDIVWELAYAPA